MFASDWVILGCPESVMAAYCIKSGKWSFDSNEMPSWNDPSASVQISGDLTATLKEEMMREVRQAQALLIIGTLMTDSSAVQVEGTRKRTRFFLVLAPRAECPGSFHVCLLPASRRKQGDTGTFLKMLYNAMSEREINQKNYQIDKGASLRLFSDNDQSVQHGCCLRVQGDHVPSTWQAKWAVWADLVRGVISRPTAKPSQPTRLRGPVVPLGPATRTKLKTKCTPGEIPQFHGYKGGHSHAPLWHSSAPQDTNSWMTSYVADPVCWNDFALFKEGTYCQQKYTASELGYGLERLKELGATESQIGAVASAVFEDVGWQQEATADIGEAQVLDYLSIDVDQATLEMPQLNVLCAPKTSNDGDKCRRNAFLADKLRELLSAEVICRNDSTVFGSFFAQQTRYSYNDFMFRTSFRGGHTYMSSTRAGAFVRINPDCLELPAALRFSARSTKRKRETKEDLCMKKSAFRAECVQRDRQLMWECVVDVCQWWNCEGPVATPQTMAQDCSRHLAGYEWVVTGGPFVHVLVALWFAVQCADLSIGPVELVVETYGTKRIFPNVLSKPNEKLDTLSEIERECDAMLEILDGTAPMQIVRLHNWLAAGLPQDKRGEFTWGIGATIKTRHQGFADRKACPLLPVVHCVPCPWATAAASGAYFVKGRREDAKWPFVPLQHSTRYTTYPIYGNMLPEALQPCTATHRRGNSLKDKVTPPPAGRAFMSPEFRRIQQYCVETRYAVGECGLQEKTSERLGAPPVIEDLASGDVSVNFELFRDRVETFATMVDQHFDYIRSVGGASARVELAVVVEPAVGAESIKDAAFRAFHRAVHDVVLIAQQYTRSYPLVEQERLVKFYVAGLKSRVQCCIEAMKPDAFSTAEMDLLRRDEVGDIALEVAESVRLFYSGRGVLGARWKTLPRIAYVHNRPILTTLRDHVKPCRDALLVRCGAEEDGAPASWLEIFYGAIGGSTVARREIPLFIPAVKNYRASTNVPGRACSGCFRIFERADLEGYKTHLCPERSNPQDYKWIKLQSPRFMDHHTKLVDSLTDQQKILLHALDNAVKMNLFVTGEAGSGKSHAVRAAIEHCYYHHGMLSTAVLAPTNIAAANIYGQTIHSFLGCGPVDLQTLNADTVASNFLTTQVITADGVVAKKASVAAVRMRNNLRFVFVDEVSLMVARDLEFLDIFLSKICASNFNRGACGRFGGVKIILIGDVLQCQPMNLLKGGGYVFQSKAFTSAETKFMVLYLRGSQRTTVHEYLLFLMRARRGEWHVHPPELEYARSFGSKVPRQVVDDAREDLQEHYDNDLVGQDKMRSKLASDFYVRNNRITNPMTTGAVAPPECLESPMHTSDRPESPYVMCLENEEIKQLNAKYLNRFEGSGLRTFFAVDDWPTDAVLSEAVRAAVFKQLPKITKLAPNMRVTVCWNTLVPGVAKNSLGVIEEIDDAGELITVRFPVPCTKDGQTRLVRVTRVKETGTATVMVNGKPVSYTGVRAQFPLQVCTAGNHFTVQGQTLARICAVFNNARVNTKSAGTAYTIISRMVDPAYLALLFNLVAEDFVVDEVALRWDGHHRWQPLPLTEVKNYSYLEIPATADPSKTVRKVQCACDDKSECRFCMDIAKLRRDEEERLQEVETGQEPPQGPVKLADILADIIARRRASTTRQAGDNAVVDDDNDDDVAHENDDGRYGEYADDNWDGGGQDDKEPTAPPRRRGKRKAAAEMTTSEEATADPVSKRRSYGDDEQGAREILTKLPAARKRPIRCVGTANFPFEKKNLNGGKETTINGLRREWLAAALRNIQNTAPKHQGQSLLTLRRKEMSMALDLLNNGDALEHLAPASVASKAYELCLACSWYHTMREPEIFSSSKLYASAQGKLANSDFQLKVPNEGDGVLEKWARYPLPRFSDIYVTRNKKVYIFDDENDGFLTTYEGVIDRSMNVNTDNSA